MSAIESLILIKVQNVSEEVLEALRAVSLGNAKQLVIGSTPGNSVVLHVYAESPAYLGAALLEFAQIPNVNEVLTLTLRNL